MLLTKKQRKKETKKSLDYNTPSPYREQGNKNTQVNRTTVSVSDTSLSAARRSLPEA